MAGFCYRPKTTGRIWCSGRKFSSCPIGWKRERKRLHSRIVRQRERLAARNDMLMIGG